MKCHGQGLCGCGHERCAVAEWWFIWGRQFRLIGIAMDRQRHVEWSEPHE